HSGITILWIIEIENVLPRVDAGMDGNFVMTGSKQLIEVQMSAEGATFSREQMNELIDLAEKGVSKLVTAQASATSA
ncbi:MAG: hypothetical protein AAFY09_12560, partial [Pseudomonadota bacterium]